MVSETAKQTGSVFTKEWVTKLMLRLSNFSGVIGHPSVKIVEPSCGGGSFVFPIVENLCNIGKNAGFRELSDVLRAYDIDSSCIETCKAKTKAILLSHGCSEGDADWLCSKWFVLGDYLLTDQKNVDLVIGNPPYVRPSNQDAEKRLEYEKALSSVTAGTDLFIGFIEKGIRSLKKDGKLCFICADRWMQNAYGKKLRKIISSDFNMDVILKMHGVQAFDDEVDAYPSIILISRDKKDAIYGDCSSSFSEKDCDKLQGSISLRTSAKNDGIYFLSVLSQDVFKSESWALSSGDAVHLLQKLEETLPTMKEDGVGLGIGVATGNDSVYVIDDPSLVDEGIALPLLKARDITSRQLPKETRHWLVNPWKSDGTLIDLKSFPKTASYLESHRTELCERHTAKQDSEKWYRTIDKVKSGLLETPKLLITDMLQNPEPILDPGRFYPHHNLYWMTSKKWDLRVLGGLLYSDMASLFVSSYGVKMRSGTMRFEAQYLKMIRVPRYESISEGIRNRLIEAFENRDRHAATEAAFDAYGLSKSEREVVINERRG